MTTADDRDQLSREGYTPVMFRWCSFCYQGVEYARYSDGGTYHFLPCGHLAPFYKHPTETRPRNE